MIPLRLPVTTLALLDPLIVRLRSGGEPDAYSVEGHDAVLQSWQGGLAEYDAGGISLSVRIDDPDMVDGDILLIPPQSRTAHRLIRARSDHNTLLVTERCDQLCIMCSQPPKTQHFDLFDSFSEACRIAPYGQYIGISGGEPLLLKTRLFDFLASMSMLRPDLRFHVLTNGQHFTEADMELVEALGAERVLWGIPLYSPDAADHDRIVGKNGAYDILVENLARLTRAGASIELRTVVMRSNINALPDLAQFITTRLPALQVWAIMQMERIGFGRLNWEREFCDTSLDFTPVGMALDIASARALPVSLYNFPLCTVPAIWRDHAAASISDWKQKYIAKCQACSRQHLCSGFFEWSPEDGGFERIVPL